MRCGGARRELTRWLDHRLPGGDRVRVEAHLSHCAACRAELADLEAGLRALRASGPTPIPRGLADRAFAAAMRPALVPPLAVGFVAVARRAAFAGALAAAAVWVGVLASGGAPQARVAAAHDPIEVAVQLWTAEAGAYAD
jgi:anti-sigma factor RsiW